LFSCEVVVVFMTLMMRATHIVVYIGLGFGLLVNTTANIISLSEYGWLGVAVGLSITVGTAIISAVFAASLMDKNGISEEKNEVSKSDGLFGGLDGQGLGELTPDKNTNLIEKTFTPDENQTTSLEPDKELTVNNE